MSGNCAAMCLQCIVVAGGDVGCGGRVVAQDEIEVWA